MRINGITPQPAFGAVLFTRDPKPEEIPAGSGLSGYALRTKDPQSGQDQIVRLTESEATEMETLRAQAFHAFAADHNSEQGLAKPGRRKRRTEAVDEPSLADPKYDTRTIFYQPANFGAPALKAIAGQKVTRHQFEDALWGHFIEQARRDYPEAVDPATYAIDLKV